MTLFFNDFDNICCKKALHKKCYLTLKRSVYGTSGIVMTKAVSDRGICYIKAVLLLCELGHLKKSKMAPPLNIFWVRQFNFIYK